MKKCQACGKEANNFQGEIVKGYSGEWVCKECLKKAKLNTLKFGCSNITADEINAKINGESSPNDVPVLFANEKASYNKKLIFCKACGKEISRQARKCPNCGHPTAGEQLGQSVKGCLLAPFIVIIIFVIIVTMVAIVSDSDSDTQNTTATVQTEIPKISIKEAYITENMFNSNELHISVENIADYTIDAYDYKVQAYNSYGEKISSSLFDDFTSTNIQIAPGESSSAQTLLPFVDNATSFKVTITRFHNADTDETVSIPKEERVWIEVKK